MSRLGLGRRSADATIGRHVRPARRRGGRVVVTGGLVLAAIAAIVAVQFPGAEGAYLARVTNSQNTAATNSYFTCTGSVQGAAGVAAFAAYPLNEASPSASAADVTGNGHTATYLSPTNTAYRVPGPCARDNAYGVTFSGGAGVTSNASFAAPTQESNEVWFKTTSTTGGPLLGLYTANTANGSATDRLLYVDSTGKVRFGVFDGSNAHTITSPLAYNDGTWHYAVATLSSTNGISLYVDGALAASDSTVKNGATFTAYTHIGVGAYSLFAGTTSTAFTGSEAYAAIYNYPLTATQVTSHYAAAGGTNSTDTNIALNKTATQSSTAFGGSPSRAVDGNTDGVYNDGSVSHSDTDTNAWWQVDIGAAAHIATINIWNRTDCCTDRLTNYWVFTSLSAFNTSLTPAQQAATSGVWSAHMTTQPAPSQSIQLPPGSQGRYVMIQQGTTSQYLSLAEIQVYGKVGG